MRKLYLFFAVLCSLLGAQTASAATTFNGGWTAYLVPDVWDTASAKFAVYVHNNEEGPQWVEMTDTDGDGYYSATVPTGVWTNIIFVRMNSTCTISSITDKTAFWNNKWNQTTDMDPSGNNCCTITGWKESDYEMSNYTPAVTITDVYLYKSGGTTQEFDLSNGNYILDEVTISTSDNYYINVKYSDNTTKAFMPSGVSGSVASGTTYNMVDRGSSEYFTFSSFNYTTVSAVLTVSEDAPATVTFTEVSATYPKVALVGEDGGSVIAYFTQDETDTWLWTLGPQTYTKANNDNPSTKYRFRVYTSKSNYTDYSVSDDTGYWFNSDPAQFDLATTSAGNFMINFGSGTGYFAVTMLNNTLVEAIISASDQSSKLSKPVEPVKLDTKEWSVTASTTEPAVFLIGDHLNKWRVTPEYQLTKNSDGVYELKNFEITKGALFRIRVFTSSTSYTDYASKADDDYWGINTWSNDVMTFDGQAGSKNFKWNLGQSMIGSLTFNLLTKGFTVDVDENMPSMDSSAPIQGVPFVSLIGEKFTQGEEFDVPNSTRSSRKPTTDSGWQDGWIQYDADGNVLIYGSGVTESAYGDGAVAGRAMYNTIWPPRNITSFMKGNFVFTSDDIIFKYDRKETKTITQSDGTSVNATYAVYKIDYVWMDGRYKIWTGWGGMLDYDLYSSSTANYAEWRTHYNYGSGAWSEDYSDEIVPDTFYGLNRSENVQEDAGAGGNFNFDEKYYFSKVEFWYNIDDNASDKKSAFIGYLANGDPIVDIKRTGKQETTGTYSVANANSTERKITDWSVALYRYNTDGDDTFIKSIGESGVSKDASDITGEFSVDNLGAGLYYYKMTVTYAAGGTEVDAETLVAESNKVRIFGIVMPTNTQVEQITETVDGKTLYSFDLKLTAEAPSELVGVTCLDNSNTEVEVLSLVDYYVIGVPKYTDTTIPLYSGVSAVNKAGETVEVKTFTDATELGALLNSDDFARYNFDVTTYLGVAPDAGNNYNMPTVTFKNVIPGDYTLYVSMGASDGDFGDNGKWEECNVMSATASVEMYVPTTHHTASAFTITAVADASENVVDGHLPLGTTDDQPVAFQKANKLSSTDGAFAQLAVTDGVLTDWALTYTVKLTDPTDASTVYTYTMEDINGKALNATKGISADFDYLPVPYSEESAGFDEKATNTTIQGINYRKPKDGSLSSTTTVGYKRTVEGATTGVVATSTESSSSDMSATKYGNYTALKEYEAEGAYVYQVQGSYENGKVEYFTNAFASITWTANTALNNAAGYYAASTHNGSRTGYNVVDNGYKWITFPDEGGEVTYNTSEDVDDEHKYDEAYRLEGYTPGNAASNFAEIAAAVGKMPIKVWYVGDTDATPASTLETVISAEYPMLVKPTLSFTTSSAMVTASVEDGAFTGKVGEDVISDKIITLSYPELLTKVLIYTTTGIEDLEAEAAGDFRIWPNPAVDVVNVAASAALGTIEIYAVDGRLVKTVEVDDTHAALEVSDLVKGTYIIRAAGAIQRMIKK